MKYLRQIILVLALMFGVAVPGRATVLVSNVWNTGDRTYPAYNDPNSPYSEMGFDYNSSGDLESAWFQGGSGTLVPVGAGGPLRGSGYGGNSATWTTYFTPASSPVTLSGAGDQIKITWIFTPTTITANTSQGLPVCLVDSSSATRLISDGSPGSAVYTGYAVYMCMAPTLAHSHSFQLMTRNVGSAALLSSSGAWTGVADGATKNLHGYDSGQQYIFVMTVTRNVADGLDIVATMTGGTLNNTGTNKASYTDATPNGSSYTFDTFAIRPSKDVSSASQFDTSLFKVEFTPGATAPAIQIDTQDQTAFVGQNATFSMLASGTAPLSYQWYYNTNTVLTNATSSTLTLTNVQLSDSGGYSVVVTNAYGSVTSSVAQLTANIPVAPSITVQPQDQSNILPGATATFSVNASGTDPLNYQWYYNTNTLLANATDSTLTITNVQPGDAGSYSVTVSNFVGGVISANAFLTVNTNPLAPVFISQPVWLVVLTNSTASFTAVAAGTASIGYQWNKNGIPIPGATSTTLTLTNVQVADDGSYTLTASNSVGAATSNPAQLTVTTAIPPVNSAFNLIGFAQAATGGGVIAETNSAYRKVTNALDLANALVSAYKTAGSVKVIEIMTNLDLGWKEVGAAVQTLASTPFRSHNAPKLHPRLITTGVSLIDIKPKSGLTIFSANGATIRHACFNIKSTANIIVRNLKFDEMWEWDETSKGNYDGNDWDFIDLGNAGTVSNIWIDHCTFTKAYDGIVDIKDGSSKITFSWNRYTGDDGATNLNSFVWQQINSLESNKPAYAMYNSLRTSSGFSTTDIVTIIQGHDKTHLVGANDGVKNANNAVENAQHSLTFHHQWFQNCWDRCVPRLRGGSVHDFNIYVDDTLALAAKRLRDQHTVNSSYSFDPFLNGSISTESGALLLEKSVYIDCLTPLRNNQTDPSNPAYTGKIKALDTIYQMDSTVVRGNSTDPGNPLGPFQATVIPFSWNTNSTTPGGVLPYTYTMDDPGQLKNIVTSSTGGAGAGVLTWNKTNWLMTSYAATAPTIVADPQSQTYPAGQSAAFTVVAGGSAPFTYQWYFNTNTPIANATNDFLTLTNVQATNAGTYSVIVSNVASGVTSAYALLTVTAANTVPTLAPVPDTNIIAGVTLNITNVAADADLPSQTLTFSLLSAPGNATLDAASGVFSWRPLISQAGTTNLITEKVADNGTPILSATRSFNVIVSAPVQPQMPSFTYSNGQLNLVITGSIGPDYIVLASTNLTDWAGIFTNPMPFTWTDTAASNFSQRYYRIQLGP